MEREIEAEKYDGVLDFGDVLREVISVIRPKPALSIQEALRGTGRSESDIFEVACTIGSLKRVARTEYKKIRTQIIQSFRAGNYPAFDASNYFDEGTEAGDLNDTLAYVLQKKIPHPPLPHDYKFSLSERVELRNFLIEELDEMVAMC
ncbi:hypothetical protein [Photobacterium kishitanii]|uniref:Uncharacterized protein n=1 Tax=Photobacterium kishitanii TaxID=318456 RepID=A0A2T3KLM8_9GAMM|nr:hypothetical protein [Photobacterium kishitanii]PSV00624.1 hypothetical protein C9J27_05665 [Photobacterium kishitanii]